MNPDLRIVSFLPAATEMVAALGLTDYLVGISHECDFPEEVKSRPAVVHCVFDPFSMTAAEIDVFVSAQLKAGKSVYAVNEAQLKAIRPTHILTQSLCEVCAPSGNELSYALTALDPRPEIIFMTPHTLAEIQGNIRELATATHCSYTAERIIAQMDKRIKAVQKKLAGRVPVKIFFMEWVDPIYCSGHWMAECIALAGGVDPLSRLGVDSVRTTWEEVLAAQPEVLVIGPCGYHTAKATQQAKQLMHLPGWDTLPAVRNKRVYAVDANSYFARPGPRVVEGIELLAHFLHPDVCEWHGDANAFVSLNK